MDSLLFIPGLPTSLLSLLLIGLGVTAPTPAPSSPAPPDDSTGAQIHTERAGDRLRVQGVFVNDDVATDTLRYELSVRRSGGTGTTQSTQSGFFTTAPGQADTLSTTQVNVQSGDTIELHLIVHRADAPLDSARVQRTIP